MKQTILKYSSLLALLSAPFLSTQTFAAECATGTSPAAGCTIDVSNTTYTLTGDLGSTALFEVIEFGNGANFNTLNLLGNITTANDHAIYFGDSDSNTISMTGNITTTLRGATGINLSRGSRANVIDLFGNITTGEDSQAIVLGNTNDNTITVIGNLTTSANAAAGIGLTFASDNTVNITGNINNDGSGITMIEGEGNAINVTGNIDTADTNADGVDMENTDSNTINITGNVTTINSSANGFILFDANRNTINLTGNITTSESDSLGIDVRGDSNTTTINGNISTTGATSSGMFLMGNSNTTTINGNISTTKDDSLGIDLSLFGSNTTTINGNITTKGEDSHGIDHSSSAQNTTNMTGNISTTGVQATGMRLSSSNNNNTNMTGDITTTGRSGMGIFITRANENTTVLTGDILTSGDLAHGIHLQQSDSNTTSVHGNISTTGSRAHGVWVEDADNNTFVITGNISTSGTYEAIFIKRSDSNTFNLSGKIQSLGVDQAIDIDGDSDGNAFIVESGATFLGDFVNYGTNTVITNQGTMDGIENTGSIATFNNYQKNLTYSGTLPDNYTTIIDDSGYGQLFVSNEAQAAAGATVYQPFAGAAGIGVKIKTNTYNNVITGVSSANLNATRSGTLTGDGTSSAGSTAWTLTETASGSKAWNLNTTGNYFYFGSVAALQSSLNKTASAIRGAFNSITTSMNFANMTTYDCNLFGSDGGCVSVGGRYTGTDNPDTTATAVVAKAGYKFNEHFRYGAFVDQTANSKTRQCGSRYEYTDGWVYGGMESESRSTRDASETG